MKLFGTGSRRIAQNRPGSRWRVMSHDAFLLCGADVELASSIHARLEAAALSVYLEKCALEAGGLLGCGHMPRSAAVEPYDGLVTSPSSSPYCCDRVPNADIGMDCCRIGNTRSSIEHTGLFLAPHLPGFQPASSPPSPNHCRACSPRRS